MICQKQKLAKVDSQHTVGLEFTENIGQVGSVADRKGHAMIGQDRNLIKDRQGTGTKRTNCSGEELKGCGMRWQDKTRRSRGQEMTG